MIGWWIVIAQQTPAERDAGADQKAATLANWETSVSGIDWIENLVEEGKATQLSHGGYPDRYTAFARDVLPLIDGGPPAHKGPTIFGDDYVMPGDWTGNVMIDREKITACLPDQILTIDVSCLPALNSSVMGVASWQEYALKWNANCTASCRRQCCNSKRELRLASLAAQIKQ